MENKINIAEILRDMPEGTKLYSPLFGKCEYIAVANNEYRAKDIHERENSS